MLFRHESCIRRDCRHELLLIGCRIHPETCVPVRRVSRLAEPGRTGSGRVVAGWTRCRIFVRLPFAQHPITCLGKVPRHSDDGPAMSLAGCKPLIETFDVCAAIRLEPYGAGGRFDQSPLEIVVDVATGASVPDASAARDDAGHEPSVAGEVLGARESFHVADLQPDQRCEDFADTGYGAEQLHLRRWLERDRNALLDLFDLGFELIERGELDSDHGRRIGWKPVKRRVDVDAALDAEQIADPSGLQSVSVDRRVDAVLERRAQVAQGHARAEEFTSVTQLAWWNPALGQGSVVQQNGESFGVERIGLVGLTHAPLRFEWVRQVGTMTGFFHLVNHPVPMAGGFEGNLARWRQAAKEVDVFLPVVLDPDCGRCLPFAVDGYED